MASQRHTPGPWYMLSGAPVTNLSRSVLADWMSNENYVGHVDVSNPANLRLIASAPELLEALRHLSDEVGVTFINAQEDRLTPSERRRLDALRSARATIAKAEGE